MFALILSPESAPGTTHAVLQTTPSEAGHKYAQRRKAIRETFWPALIELDSTVVKFVVGRPNDRAVGRAFSREVRKNARSFLFLDMEVRIERMSSHAFSRKQH
jgi:hypothetical protein